MAFVRSHDERRRAAADRRATADAAGAALGAANDPLFETDPTLQASLAQLEERPADAGRDGAAGRVGRDAAAATRRCWAAR